MFSPRPDFMNLHLPTKSKNRGISSIYFRADRPSRARGNPGLVAAELAWIPAFAGKTKEMRFVNVSERNVLGTGFQPNHEDTIFFKASLRELRMLHGKEKMIQ